MSQGDILQGIRLFHTRSDWSKDGGETSFDHHPYSMVVSRPCVAKNDTTLTVVAIVKALTKPKAVETFDDAKFFLREMRDGLNSPDSFYLGQLPRCEPGRYMARLDAYYTVKLPAQAARSDILKKHRIARLHDDFIHDLHVRIFNSFAKLGFEDDSWHSKEDLEWLVHMGDAQIGTMSAELSGKRAQKALMEAGGTKIPGSLPGEIANLDDDLKSLKGEVDSYRAELEVRKRASPNTSGDSGASAGPSAGPVV